MYPTEKVLDSGEIDAPEKEYFMAHDDSSDVDAIIIRINSREICFMLTKCSSYTL